MKITAHQRQILTHIQENGYVPFDASPRIRNRMQNVMGLYTSQRNTDGTWTDVLTDKGREVIAPEVDDHCGHDSCAQRRTCLYT